VNSEDEDKLRRARAHVHRKNGIRGCTHDLHAQAHYAARVYSSLGRLGTCVRTGDVQVLATLLHLHLELADN
jgi:hypothetical protein